MVYVEEFFLSRTINWKRIWLLVMVGYVILIIGSSLLASYLDMKWDPEFYNTEVSYVQTNTQVS